MRGELPTPHRWARQIGVETWTLTIEADRFVAGTDLAVTVDIAWHDGTDDHFALAIARPEQAREMAAALIATADLVEKAS